MTTSIAVETQPMYIGGEWVHTGERLTVKMPYDGSPIAELCQADTAALNRAIEAAQRGAPAMAEMTCGERADLLLRLHDVMKRDQAEFSHLICLETGKPIKEARIEAERSLQTILSASTEARILHGEMIPIDSAPIGKGRMAMTIREPIGIVAAITPFNVPLNLALHKVCPAIAAGNAVVHKPAEQTSLSSVRLAHALEEAGLPKGAYNLVLGSGSKLGPLLARDPRIAMITFTGSVPVGKSIRAIAGLKRVTLELGNNSAVIVEPDADLDLAASRCVPGAFSHSGQVCISVQRIYVHESVADDFTSRYVENTGKLKIGHPLEDSTDISSLINDREAVRVDQWIEEAVHGGAQRLTGGPRQFATIPPTVLAGAPADVKISCQEVFGPVVNIVRYRDFEQAIALANDSEYGLQAGIFTNNIQRAFSAARKLQVGGVIINDVSAFRADHMPYGGVKESGNGREGPRYAIEEMTELKLICWRV
ncbi:MAG: aldehyde dehydrogenase family protein [Bryobacteraceae bacterium]